MRKKEIIDSYYKQTESYKFEAIYEFTNIIYKFVYDVEYEYPYYGFDEELFAESATKFNKYTLLHNYVVCTLYGYYREYVHDNGDEYDEDRINWWCDIMAVYGVTLRELDFDVNDDETDMDRWFEENSDSFFVFFNAISDEIVHVLYGNTSFLVKFNQRMSYIVQNYNIENQEDKIPFPEKRMNKNGTIKRCDIPQWVKNAVFNRDYGHCVFCGRDLSRTTSHIHTPNYDHIIPLREYGVNDPCNIQLCCEECNKKKGPKLINPEYRYQKLW